MHFHSPPEQYIRNDRLGPYRKYKSGYNMPKIGTGSERGGDPKTTKINESWTLLKRVLYAPKQIPPKRKWGD